MASNDSLVLGADAAAFPFPLLDCVAFAEGEAVGSGEEDSGTTVEFAAIEVRFGEKVF
jgi:hypothetical protein